MLSADFEDFSEKRGGVKPNRRFTKERSMNFVNLFDSFPEKYGLFDTGRDKASFDYAQIISRRHSIRKVKLYDTYCDTRNSENKPQFF